MTEKRQLLENHQCRKKSHSTDLEFKLEAFQGFEQPKLGSVSQFQAENSEKPTQQTGNSNYEAFQCLKSQN